MRVFWEAFWKAIETFGYFQTLKVLAIGLAVLGFALLIVWKILDFFTVGNPLFESDWARLRRRLKQSRKR
jgi:hypothetical protein